MSALQIECIHLNANVCMILCGHGSMQVLCQHRYLTTIDGEIPEHVKKIVEEFFICRPTNTSFGIEVR